ncbi:hypothetical protein [Zunongwangia pacifica]|uniref:Uncharacterized protein n=1 Tax=Zunongwangia pacifica TaxID=2911062 RepID=A0A9X1ZUQ0_9FLAO|nr:hypothetical protein [Zunongwangia pacifica]MCL6217910.1 hypothetical protein [Zunongwangia pacifica]
MKKIILVLILLVNGVSLSAQTEVARLQSFLKVGEQLDCGNYSIVIKGVISDSRCPKSVTCVWAGTAEVLLEIRKANEVWKEYRIEIGNSIDADFQLPALANINLKLLGLAPYPETPIKIKPSEYQVTIQLEEQLN